MSQHRTYFYSWDSATARVGRLVSLLFLLAALLSPSSGSAEPVAGPFRWPIQPLNAYRSEAPHMSWYPTLNGYHMGEDWNRGSCNDDEGDDLYPIADGTVVFIENRPNQLAGKGRMIVVRHDLPDDGSVYSAYIHLTDISTALNRVVRPSQRIASIGRSGLSVDDCAHLHWEIHTEQVPNAENPYYGGVSPRGVNRKPMTVANAIRYTSPSLFIDDRSRPSLPISLRKNERVIFRVAGHAPSSTAYVEETNTGLRYGIAEAVRRGLVAAPGIQFGATRTQHNVNITWLRWDQPRLAHFEPLRPYSAIALQDNLRLHVIIPGHNYRQERAIADMLCRAADLFTASTTTFDTRKSGETPGWDRDWELRHMEFVHSRSTTTLWHATNSDNPLLRYTIYWDSGRGQWTEWVRRETNNLYCARNQ